LQKCWVPFVKPSENFDIRKAVGFDAAMFPEMDFGKIIETGIVKGANNGLSKSICSSMA